MQRIFLDYMESVTERELENLEVFGDISNNTWVKDEFYLCSKFCNKIL
jgi:hypothetical protein